VADIMFYGIDARFLMVLVLVALVLLLVLGGGGRRRQADGAAAGAKPCPHCGADHPRFARFCRKCGRKLPEV
jgi:hypothetical protein